MLNKPIHRINKGHPLITTTITSHHWQHNKICFTGLVEHKKVTNDKKKVTNDKKKV